MAAESARDPREPHMSGCHVISLPSSSSSSLSHSFLFFSSLGKPGDSWGGGRWGEAGEKKAADDTAATPTTREDAAMATMIGTARGSSGGATAPHPLSLTRAQAASHRHVCRGGRAQDPACAGRHLVPARRSPRDVQGDLQVLQGGMHTRSRPCLPSDKRLKAAFAAAASLLRLTAAALPLSPVASPTDVAALVILKFGYKLPKNTAAATKTRVDAAVVMTTGRMQRRRHGRREGSGSCDA
uniref:Uncharacterized protein n=1 Tax=Oryza meridionalis TaxID=40149 RepID=A0A0E0CIB0_9ORYZ